MKRAALGCSKGLALPIFFLYTILFSQSYVNDPDLQMLLFMKKKDFLALFHELGETASSRLE